MFVLMAATVVLVTVDLVRGGTEPQNDAQLVGASTPADGGEPILALPGTVQPTRKPDPKLPAPKVVPKRGSGSFTVAAGAGATVGAGKLLRYRVESENGSNEPPAVFAAAVDATLADPRGWTAAGEWSFRRVSSGPVDFVVRLATPDTVDRVCSAAGLDTAGYVSCRTGQFVMINLARWELAVPEYNGNIALYRNYVINHEVGHRLGHGHELCPGAGRPAPIMQQQTYGLKGCTQNGWPFINGHYISGPKTAAD